MKKTGLTFIFLLFVGFCFAQDIEQNNEKPISKDGKNLLKINLLSLPLKNYSLGFEHKLGKKITAGIGYRFMPNGQMPFLSKIKTFVDDPDVAKQLNELYVSNTAISPEIRFYLGKQAMRGFYLAPFSRISNYKIAVPIEYEENNIKESIPMSGELKTFTAGLQIGAQWKLGGRVYLDWWILGPQYGKANGSLSGKKALTANEQAEIRKELEGLDIPFVTTTTTVNSSGARLDIKGPWASIRAGLNLGFRF
ncbi:DUF3575 domain-containing protein [Daejeonella sp.]|uniref:DUF3575 domain-containing protein n=1 Tax=Daejeonella sp. TaxID=2805397 RepID=UPI0025C6F9FC|nr:DUF3575 domain-containing protein [Daejeonella sp.]